MEIRDLRTLIGIAEFGSLAGAARQLNLTQPALSASLKRLEGELGVVLVRRHSRGAEITEEGRLVLQKAYAIMHDVSEITSVARDLSATPVGDVRIGLPTTVAGGIIVDLVERVHRRLPHVHLHIVEAMSGGLAELLQLGRLDLAILFDIQPMAGLSSEPILTEEPQLLLPASHPFLTRRTASFDDVAALRLVLPSEVHSIRKLIERFAKAEGVALNVVADVDSLRGLLKLVVAGYATILPTYLANEFIRAGRIAPLRLSRPRPEWTVHLATRQDSVRPRASLATARIIVEICTELVIAGHWPGKVHPRQQM